MKVKYDRIGIDYNLTRRADKYITERLSYLLDPDKTGIYLDIGGGTGNYTIALQRESFQLIGIDPSIEMLAKAKEENEKISWQVGVAENTGLETESIDGVTAILTIHHWADLEKGFSELSRVLKVGGRMVIFASTPNQMAGYWLNHYFPKMLKSSAIQMPSFEILKAAMEKAGVGIAHKEKYFIKPDLQDKFLYCGKENPVLYFKEELRKGISSFADLANQGSRTRPI